MSGRTTVDRQDLLRAVSQIDNSVQQINSVQSTLTNQVADLRAGWVGRASNAFGSAHEAFNQSFDKVKNSLVEIKELMSASQSSYEETEETQAQATNQILSLLEGN